MSSPHLFDQQVRRFRTSSPIHCSSLAPSRFSLFSLHVHAVTTISSILRLKKKRNKEPFILSSSLHRVVAVGKMARVPDLVLNSGWKMPFIGLGTTAEQLPPPHILTSIFIHAIEIGYRHFDTAALYNTEKQLGQAIAQALQRGLIQSRDQLFITSKLWCTDAHPDLLLPALHTTLENLQLEYLDIYLIHMPIRMKQGEIKMVWNKEDLLPMDIKSTWAVMEESHKLGLTKSIGVSNFSCKKISELLSYAKIIPAVNQVEMNTGWQQWKLRELCVEKGIHVCAWSPLGANGAPWGSLAVMDSPLLKQIAQDKGKSVAQIALRWLVQQGVSPIVKSFNEGRMKENLDVFDWELSGEELQKISEIPQKRGFSGELFVSAQGPFKSTEEFWDGEI